MTVTTSKFLYIADARLPTLAWIAGIDSFNQATIRHGAGVEVHGRFFAEAIWTGDFARGELLQNDCLFGSGGEALPDGIGFATSIATTDALFEASRNGQVFVSNSLPLLLCEIDDRLDPQFAGYAAINRSLTAGIFDYVDRLPTMHGCVRRHLHRNLLVSNGDVSIVAKNLTPAFSGFEAYRDLLVHSIAALVANARSPARAHPLPIFSTQSKGYDSTCINALMKPHGIDTVFTIPAGKGHYSFADRDADVANDDDGTEIATTLGFPAQPIERRVFEAGLPDELLYWASIHRNGDMNFAGIHAAITARLAPGQPAILLAGWLGEIWYPSDIARTAFGDIHADGLFEDGALRIPFLCGLGLSEVRLAVGYLHVSPAYIGARRRDDIVAISNAPDMRPWRCVAGYDRPIARRIAEEAGVPRQMFGQVKRATVVDFAPPDVPRRADLRRSFNRFLRTNRLASRLLVLLLPLVHRYNSLAHYTALRPNPIGYRVTQAYRKLRRTNERLPQLGRHLDGAIFCFAVNEVAHRYQDGHSPQ